MKICGGKALGDARLYLAYRGCWLARPFSRLSRIPLRWPDYSRITFRALGFDEMTTAFDFEPVFKSNVALSVFDYVAHGSDSEWTMLRNREAFEWIDIVSRPALDVSAVNLSTELFGLKLESPLFVAPSRIASGTHPEGTPGMRRGASDAKTLYMIPSPSDPGFHQADRVLKYWNDTVKAGSYPFFWQFYPSNDLKASREVLEKMQADGARAIAITCDQQSPYYPRDIEDRNLGGNPIIKKPKEGVMSFAHGPRGPCVNCHNDGRGGAMDATPIGRNSKGRWWYTWKYLDQIREFIKVPMLAKGIITPEDAELCIQHGLDGVYVSNDGGRALCYEPSTIEVLPDILAAVRGRVPVLFDGGVRHGIDVFKALALGAKAVGLGRAPMWALGAYGAPGVTRLFEIMQKELVAAMAKAGRPTVASLDPSAVKAHFV